MTAPAMQTTQASRPPASGQDLTKRQKLLLLWTQLFNERSSYISHWQSINRVLFPRRGRFQLTDANRGDRRNKDIFDSTATMAARTLASGMMSGITSPARDWFRLTTEDPDLADFGSVKQWLHLVTQNMRKVFLKSNFYKVIHRVYGDMGVYGTAPFLLDEDERDVIRCYDFPVGSYCIANDARLMVGTFGREYMMTVRQLIAKFGFEKCSQAVKNQWERGSTEAWVPVTHVIYPNDEYNATLLSSKYKPFASCYFEQGNREREDHFLSESGYDQFPILVARWDVTSEDAYATECPGMIALGDINQLQFGAKKGLQALEKHVNPPLIGPSALQNRVVNMLPGGVTYDDAEKGRGLRPLHDVRPDLDKLRMWQLDGREMIREAFYADLFRMVTYLDEIGGKQPVTAAEIYERKEEKLLALGPVLSQLDQDVYNPLIDRTFAIMLKRGLIPPAPPELEGQELKVEYISIMHAAQKAAGQGQLERFVLFGRGLAEAKAQDQAGVLDKWDTDEMIDEYHEMSGIPPRSVRSDEDVAAIRDQRAKAVQAQQQAAALKDASQGAKNLAQADTGGKNALTDVLERIGAGA